MNDKFCVAGARWKVQLQDLWQRPEQMHISGIIKEIVRGDG